MQEKEFDKLMVGEPSKIAFLPENMNPNKINMDFIKNNEVPTPPKMVSAVDIWIDRCKKLGMSEKNIRKSVLRRFKIKLINNK